jgi:hypothetical protein
MTGKEVEQDPIEISCEHSKEPLSCTADYVVFLTK